MGDKEDCGYDAIVVGSGYGGSIAACRMSLAGTKVCLIEKGRRWKAEDFPDDSLKLMSAVRMENQNLGISFGPKHALFQVILCGLFFLYLAAGLHTLKIVSEYLESNLKAQPKH